MHRIPRRRFLSYIGASAVTLPILGCLDEIDRALKIPTSTTFDVVIVGATPSGIMAARAAARGGATVAVIEATQHAGGMYSSGLGIPNFGDVSTIGGLQQQFYLDVGAYYGFPNGQPEYYFEPHVAENIFNSYLSAENISVFLGRTVASAQKTGTRINSLTLDNGTAIKALQWIDASYEGDLMAASGATYVVGREAASQYREMLAGWGQQNELGFFPNQWSGSLVAGINPDPNETNGQADRKIMAYTFFPCLTSDSSNMMPFSMPPDYSPSQYLAVKLCIERNGIDQLADLVSLLPLTHNSKYLLLSNTSGETLLSSDFAGASWGYPNADWPTREQIRGNHHRYVAGLLYFLANDQSVPGSIRSAMGTYGLALDEFTDNGHWPWQMYVREGRRLVGKYVMIEPDLIANPKKTDSVGLNNWPIDCHTCDLFAMTNGYGHAAMVIDGWIYNKQTVTYELPFSSMLPIASEVTNLAVVVCLSASHIAFCSLRVEPGLMALGEAAGTAAALALNAGVDLSSVNVSQLQSTLVSYGGVISL